MNARPGFPPLVTADAPNLIVHTEVSWYQDVASGRFDGFEKLGTKAQAEGIDVGLVQALHSAQLSQAECDY